VDVFFSDHSMSFYINLCLILTLPYHTGKACYRITPRPPVDQCVLLFHHKWYPVIKDRSVPVNVVPIMYTSAYYQCHRQALTICMTRWPSVVIQGHYYAWISVY